MPPAQTEREFFLLLMRSAFFPAFCREREHQRWWWRWWCNMLVGGYPVFMLTTTEPSFSRINFSSDSFPTIVRAIQLGDPFYFWYWPFFHSVAVWTFVGLQLVLGLAWPSWCVHGYRSYTDCTVLYYVKGCSSDSVCLSVSWSTLEEFDTVVVGFALFRFPAAALAGDHLTFGGLQFEVRFCVWAGGRWRRRVLVLAHKKRKNKKTVVWNNLGY